MKRLWSNVLSDGYGRFIEAMMRTEIYEKYKTEHPEELQAVQALYDNNGRIEDVRKDAQLKKLDDIFEWERRLADE